MKNTEPAFPGEQCETQGGTWNQTWNPGLTKRELFAAMAMQGYLAGRNGGEPSDSFKKEIVAAGCVNYADALLAELAKEPAR